MNWRKGIVWISERILGADMTGVGRWSNDGVLLRVYFQCRGGKRNLEAA
jgi:hypothetical protein